MTVKHVFSGKSHFFEVEGKTDHYSVILQVNCTCRDFTIKKCCEGGFCKHILEVMKYVYEQRGCFEEAERVLEPSQAEQQKD